MNLEQNQGIYMARLCMGPFLLFEFFLRTFTIQRPAGEGGGYLFNSSLPLPPASQTLRH